MTNEQRQPPDAIFKYVNPLIGLLLRSPFSGILSGRLMLLSYVGAKSGRRYTTPAGYYMWADDQVLAFSRSRWPLRVLAGREVRLYIHGVWYDATPSLVETAEERAAILREFIQRYGPGTARKLPLGLPRDRPPTEEDLLAAAEGTKVVFFHISI